MERKPGIKNFIAYGVGDLYGGGSFFIIGSLTMYYLVAVVGLSPLLAGLVPGLGKIWDAFSDPVMGYITDNTKSKFGRRRVFFLIAIFPVLITFSLIWFPVRSWFPDFFSTDLSVFLYYFIAYLFFYTVSTMTMIPYSALSAEMTTDFKQRNKLTSTRMIFSILSAMIAGGLAQPIVNSYADPSTGYLVMGLVFGALYALPWIFVFLGTWELPYENVKPEGAMNIFGNFGTIFRNRSFRIHIMMYISAYAALDILMGWLLFYLTDCIERPELFAILLPALVLAEVLCVPFYAWLSNRTSHARSFILGLTIWGAGMVWMAFQAKDVPAVLLVINCVIIGAGLSAGAIIPFNILPFITDVDELITKKKRAGTYSGAMTLVRKLIQGALVLPLLGILLTAIEYKRLSAEDMAVNKSAAQISGAVQSIKKADDKDKIIKAADKIENFANRIKVSSAKIADEEKKKRFTAEADLVLAEAAIIKSATDIESSKSSAAKAALVSDGIVTSLKIKQSPHTVYMMRIMFVASPLVFILLGIFFGFKFRITPYSHGVLMKEIGRLSKGGSKKDVDNETKQICEELTGQKYEDLYK